MTHPIFALCESLGISPLSLREGGGERGDFFVPTHEIGRLPEVADVERAHVTGSFLNLFMTDLWYLKAVDALYREPDMPEGERKVPKDRLDAVNGCLAKVSDYLGTNYEPIDHAAPAQCRCDALLYLSKPARQLIRENPSSYSKDDVSFYLYNTYRHAKAVYEMHEDDAAFCPTGEEKPLLLSLLMAEPDIHRVASTNDASILFRRAIKIADAFWGFYQKGDVNKYDKLVMCNLTAKGLGKILYFLGRTSYDE